MLKSEIKFTSKVPQAIESFADFIEAAVEKSLAVATNAVIKETPFDHGNLAKSIALQSRMTSKSSAEIRTNVKYAVYQEFGTKYMAPRAMFRKGVSMSQDRIKEIFNNEAKNVKI